MQLPDHWSVVEKYFQARNAWERSLVNRGVPGRPVGSTAFGCPNLFDEYDRCWQEVMALDGQDHLPDLIQSAINAYKALLAAGGGRGNDVPGPKVQKDLARAGLNDKIVRLGDDFEDARWSLQMVLLNRRLSSRSEDRHATT